MYEPATRDELERFERAMQRVFARVSVLEARVNQLELELEVARRAARAVVRPQLVASLRRTA